MEAESTAFVVCHALGLDTSETSFPYVAEWAHAAEPEGARGTAGPASGRRTSTDAAKQLATTGQRILSAATRLLEVLAPEAAAEKEAA